MVSLASLLAKKFFTFSSGVLPVKETFGIFLIISINSLSLPLTLSFKNF